MQGKGTRKGIGVVTEWQRGSNYSLSLIVGFDCLEFFDHDSSQALSSSGEQRAIMDLPCLLCADEHKTTEQ